MACRLIILLDESMTNAATNDIVDRSVNITQPQFTYNQGQRKLLYVLCASGGGRYKHGNTAYTQVK